MIKLIYSRLVTNYRAHYCSVMRCRTRMLHNSQLHFYAADVTEAFMKYRSSFASRTHDCGELRAVNVGNNVRLCGWLQYQRSDKFLILRDAHGLTQIILDETQIANLPKLTLESVLSVEGEVFSRPSDQINKTLPTGQIEVLAKKVSLLNKCEAQLPFSPNSQFQKVNEASRMEHRYIDLRHKHMQYNLRTRSTFIMAMRKFLCEHHGFVDVETPTLFRKTPGGAREFIVPTNKEGAYYALPQSPQQFKQLLMVGGIDRYMQIARCYRDETSRSDRQPEFTQLDIEMSFTSKGDIQNLIEGLLSYSWPTDKPPIQTPFKRLSYSDAMKLYGSDKPDVRFDMLIQDVTSSLSQWDHPAFRPNDGSHTVKVINFKGAADHLSNKDMKPLYVLAKQFPHQWHTTARVSSSGVKYKYDASLSKPIYDVLQTELRVEPGDLLLMVTGTHDQASTLLGQWRIEVANLLEEKGAAIRGDADRMEFLWVEDFPLFSPHEDGAEGLTCTHHPFTAPHDRQEQLVYTEPEQVMGQHYDLVLNGYEIGGGSIRIHDSRLQRYILTDILKTGTFQLEHLLRALDYGCPPHGGIALGLDRLMMIICNTPSIRDVIAFPKSKNGQDLMSKAPSDISEEDRKYYHQHKK